MKLKNLIGNSQLGFRKGKSHLTNLTAFYNGEATLVDERRAVDVAYLSFTEALVQLKASPECCISGLTNGPKAVQHHH